MQAVTFSWSAALLVAAGGRPAIFLHNHETLNQPSVLSGFEVVVYIGKGL
jgi:hypothetical protein